MDKKAEQVRKGEKKKAGGRDFKAESNVIMGLRSKLEQTICQAYDEGYSVFEIARAALFQQIDYVHRVLKRNKKVVPLKRGCPKKFLLEIPALVEVFKQKKTTFAMWCHLSGFDQEEAHRALLDKHGEQSVFSRDVHLALYRDIPDQYAELFPGHCALPISQRTTCTTIPAVSEMEMSIVYNQEKRLFVASWKGYEDYKGWGISCGTAATQAERLWWINKSILRLQCFFNQ